MKTIGTLVISMLVVMLTACREKSPSALDNLLKIELPDGEIIYAHPTDNQDSINWGGHEREIPNLTGIFTVEEANQDFDGQAHTLAIIAEVGDNDGVAYAAKFCDELEAFGCDDWYLPASGELNEIYLQHGPKGSGQIMTGYYWSSTASNDIGGWLQGFEDSLQTAFYRNQGVSTGIRCRCVRK